MRWACDYMISIFIICFVFSLHSVSLYSYWAAVLAAERSEEQEVVLRRVRDEVGIRLYAYSYIISIRILFVYLLYVSYSLLLVLVCMR